MAVLPSLRNLRTVLQSVLFVPISYALFFNMIPVFLSVWDNATRVQDRFEDNFRGRQNTYDFIVVGGGTAGAVVANRLSEFHSVLLLEAGGQENPLQLVPALATNFLNQAQTDWSYKTVPQRRACLNSVNQQSSWSAGRTIGGSSSLSLMAFQRGHPVDFDNWALITGERSWSYAEVLPFFRRIEEFIGSTTDSDARGGNGELRIRQPNFIGLGQDWTAAGLEMGFTNIDFNGMYSQGFGVLQYPLRRGMRQSTASAFLKPIRLGPRLRILRQASANRILFRDMTNMAYGVEFTRFGRTELAIASREVILCAGTLGSAKLLMLSGIGPRQHLTDMGIPVRADLPVGQNLMDHLGVQLGPFYMNSAKSYLQDREVTPENIVRWAVKGQGPLTSTGIQAAAAFSSSLAQDRGETNWPDLLLLLQGQGIHQQYARDFARAYGIQEDEMATYYQEVSGRDAFHIRVIGARPTSTGSVLLSSANPTDPLVVNPRYLEDAGDGDLRVLQQGVEMALHLVENTTAFRNLGAEFTSRALPGCGTEFRSESYWSCYIQRFSLSQYNPVGTVALGAVLDANLKVRSTRGLRVIDASVMPTIVSVGTLASTLMIAEKGSDAILREFGSTTPNRNLLDTVFGRNGIIAKNPIQRFLSSEFDKLNPLPVLFRNPTNSSDFNPFTRLFGIFGIGGNQTLSGNPNLKSLLNLSQTLQPFASLLMQIFGALVPPPPRPTAPPTLGNNRNVGGGALTNLFQSLFPPPRSRPSGSLSTVGQRNTTPFLGTNLSVGNNRNKLSLLNLLLPSLNPSTTAAPPPTPSSVSTPTPSLINLLSILGNTTRSGGRPNLLQLLDGGTGTSFPILTNILRGNLSNPEQASQELLSKLFPTLPNYMGLREGAVGVPTEEPPTSTTATDTPTARPLEVPEVVPIQIETSITPTVPSIESSASGNLALEVGEIGEISTTTTPTISNSSDISTEEVALNELDSGITSSENNTTTSNSILEGNPTEVGGGDGEVTGSSSTSTELRLDSDMILDQAIRIQSALNDTAATLMALLQPLTTLDLSTNSNDVEDER